MSKTNKQKELNHGELKSRKRMYKAKKNWVIAGATVAMGIMVLGATVGTTQAHAEEWTANSTEQIASRISDGQTSITMEDGDTVWEIGQAINIANPMNLLKDNGIAEGQQYTLEIGTIISWDGNHVTVTDKDGNVIGDKIVTDDEKVEADKTVANQESDTPQARGGQLEQKTVAPEQAETPVAPSTNTTVTTPNSVLPSVPAVDNGTVSEALKPSNPVEKPADKPADKPVTPSKPEVKKFAVTVIHKDEAGNILGKDADVKVEDGVSFTAKAKSFTGFTLVGNATQTVKVTADTTITFTYKANEVTPTPVEKFNVTVSFVDEDGKIIADKVVNEVEAGTEFTATAKNIDGYTVKGEATQTVTVDGNKTLTFTYSKNAVTPPEVQKFDVTINFVDTDGNVIADKDVVSVEYGQEYTATAKNITGFTLQGTPTQTVTVDGNKTVTFTYKKDEVTPPVAQKFDVTVEFKDTDGNTIADKDVVQVEEGQKYTATAKTVNGYSVQGNATQEVTVDGNKTVTFTYTKNVAPVEKFNVTVKHVDTDGNTVAPNETQEVEKGQVFTANAKTVSGYTLQGTATQTVTVDGNKTITFTYKKDVAPVEKFNVTVEYKDTEGNTLSTDSPVEVEKGASFTATAKTIAGYTLQSSSTQTVTVTGNTTVTFTYKKDAVAPVVDKSALQTLVTNVQDTAKGNFTDDSYSLFETQLAVAKSVLADSQATQAEVDSAKTNLQTAFDNLAEKPVTPVEKFSVTVQNVDTDGTVLSTETPVEVEKGQSFTATAKNITGYTLQGNTTQTVTVSGDTTITFTYKKDEVTPPVTDVSAVEAQIASQTMNLINAYRNENGLKSLRPQAQIQNAVNDRANEIVTDYSHNNTSGGMGMDDAKYGYNGMSTGENIGRYNNPSSLDYFIQNGASLAFNAWKNSADHNAYMLATDITEGAVGIHLEDNGSGKYTMFSVFIGGLQDDEWGNDNSLDKSSGGASSRASERRAVAPQSANLETEETTNKVEETTLSEEAPESKVEETETTESTVETPASKVEDSTLPEEATPQTVEAPETQSVEVATPVNPLAVGNFNKLFATKAEANAVAMEQVKLEGGEWFNATFKVTEVQMSDGTVQYGVDFTASQVDKSELAEAYNISLSLSEENYDTHTWSTLAIKIGNAKNVYDDTNATQQQVNNAKIILVNTINNM